MSSGETRQSGIASSSSGGGVLERLVSRGWEFDFLQAAWLLERVTEKGVRVGGRGPVSEEPIRFRPDVSVSFPPTDLCNIVAGADEQGRESYLLNVSFLGLYGVSTPLPLHYAIDMLRAVDPYVAPQDDQSPNGHPGKSDAESYPARDFLDLFHHRLISLFYRAWTKYRYDVSFSLTGRDIVTAYLHRLIGHAPDFDEAMLGVIPLRLIRYAGSLTQHPRSATTLEGLLTDYWGGLEIRIEQHIGRWVSLSHQDMNCVGQMNCRLGVDLTVGEQVYDLAGAFNVVIGPVDWKTYVSFLPDGVFHAQTRALVKRFCADPLLFSLEVKLEPNQAPPMRLGSDEGVSRLGYTGWLRTDEIPETSVIFDESSAISSTLVEQEFVGVG